jgi:tetratricopeptide (TPR) repeat protein
MLRRLFGGKPQDEEVAAVEVGTGNFLQEIVGESHYQDRLLAIAAGRIAEGKPVKFRVVLIPEPKNEYDPNAVAVHAENGGIIGYLSREDAEEYQPAIVAFKKRQGGYPSCNAMTAGGHGDYKSIGVRLDIDLDEVSGRGMGRQTESRVGGEIGYFGLGEWWLRTFTDAERKHIDRLARKWGDRSVTKGEVSFSSGSAANLLSGLAGNFDRGEDQQIPALMLGKAEELAKEAGRVLDLHFTYQRMIKMYYSRRETDPTALDSAIAACERQIELAPEAAKAFRREWAGDALPSHTGFSQLAIIREKQKEYAEAIRVSRLAMEQQWAGEWDRRIERNQKRLAKS